jgi:hypothetical protein
MPPALFPHGWTTAEVAPGVYEQKVAPPTPSPVIAQLSPTPSPVGGCYGSLLLPNFATSWPSGTAKCLTVSRAQVPIYGHVGSSAEGTQESRHSETLWSPLLLKLGLHQAQGLA